MYAEKYDMNSQSETEHRTPRRATGSAVAAKKGALLVGATQ